MILRFILKKGVKPFDIPKDLLDKIQVDEISINFRNCSNCFFGSDLINDMLDGSDKSFYNCYKKINRKTDLKLVWTDIKWIFSNSRLIHICNDIDLSDVEWFQLASLLDDVEELVIDSYIDFNPLFIRNMKSASMRILWLSYALYSMDRDTMELFLPNLSTRFPKLKDFKMNVEEDMVDDFDYYVRTVDKNLICIHSFNYPHAFDWFKRVKDGTYEVDEDLLHTVRNQYDYVIYNDYINYEYSKIIFES